MSSATRYTSLALVLCACNGAPSRADTAARDSVQPSPAANVLTIRAEGIGPLIFGADPETANALLGETLRPMYEPFVDFDTCDYLYATGLPGLAFMVLRESTDAASRIERVDVDAPGILTDEGVGVGDSEARVLEVYGDRVQRTHSQNSPMEGAALLIVTTTDTLHRLIFETDGSRIVSYRAGRRPAVDFGEGCA